LALAGTTSPLDGDSPEGEGDEAPPLVVAELWLLLEPPPPHALSATEMSSRAQAEAINGLAPESRKVWNIVVSLLLAL
jgi:hypothetical protein